jgi:hypothetical protein
MVDRDIEWRASIYIPHFRIGSVIQKELRDVVVTAVECGHQWSDTFKNIGNVDVCASTDKRLNTVIAAVTSRIVERGQAAVGVILSPGLRRHLGWPIRRFGAGLHIGAL